MAPHGPTKGLAAPVTSVACRARFVPGPVCGTVAPALSGAAAAAACWQTCASCLKPSSPRSLIPTGMLPADGRFGSGPSKVRTDAVASLLPRRRGAPRHEPPPKARQVAGRAACVPGLAELFALPDGYEVVLGNGGTTAFWDIATFCLIDGRSQHLSFGEFSSKFAAAAEAAPWLDRPRRRRKPGRHAPLGQKDGRDRPLRPHPQRDLDRRDDGNPPARRRRRRGSRRRGRHFGGGGPAGRRPRSSTSTTSRPRRASLPTGGYG